MLLLPIHPLDVSRAVFWPTLRHHPQVIQLSGLRRVTSSHQPARCLAGHYLAGGIRDPKFESPKLFLRGVLRSKTPWLKILWIFNRRSRGDSNPRNLAAQRFSRPPPSTTRTPLLLGDKGSQKPFESLFLLHCGQIKSLHIEIFWPYAV